MAIQYATSSPVPMSRFVRGALASLYTGVSWHFYVARGHGRIIVIDTGSDEFADHPRGTRSRRWRIDFAMSVPEALSEAGIAAHEVTDVVLTHRHWDHTDGVRHFTKATVHMHRKEWNSMCAQATPAQRAILFRAKAENRTRLFDSCHKVVAPGFFLEVAGGHTTHHLVAHLMCLGGAVVVGGDAAYMYMNIECELPITATRKPKKNLVDLMRLRATVGSGRLLPGHDPAIFNRFRLISPHVAMISE